MARIEKTDESTRYTIAQADIDLLRDNGVSEDDIAHCVKVAEKALEIAYRTNSELDFEFIGRGALFHDLGKAKTHDITHGKIGAEMGKALGLIWQVFRFRLRGSQGSWLPPHGRRGVEALSIPLHPRQAKRSQRSGHLPSRYGPSLSPHLDDLLLAAGFVEGSFLLPPYRG